MAVPDSVPSVTHNSAPAASVTALKKAYCSALPDSAGI
eukprot:CAMPEP_0195509618 /NCGR_PEP_ID=MMETSP0794_2-20130614/2509_1 /TAXON_ID=515487 /ORGANISM="Stephanopyxis turris, Strain CCMP 815" /LENGTH=37 /DNA_ID= /DNA_START= /DNA_END= /DNA_ORIENTATION=